MRKFACAVAVCALSTVAFGQVTTLVENRTATTNGVDHPLNRDTTVTYDLHIDTTGVASDWTAAEVSIDAFDSTTIWHATNQLDIPPTGNLTPPFVAAGLGNSVEYDTFFTTPGTQWFTIPSFAAPGGIVSTDQRIRGLNSQGAEIPLAWFDTASTAGGSNFIGVRLTLNDDAGLTLDNTGLVAATIVGTTAWASNPAGEDFSFTVYRLPEPGTLGMLVLGAAAGLIRRR